MLVGHVRRVPVERRRVEEGAAASAHDPVVGRVEGVGPLREELGHDQVRREDEL